MSLKKAIRKGDTTTHGGIVLEGVNDFCIMGKEAACMGHMVSCPKCQGTYPIIEGTAGMPIGDKFIAVEGMKTACGAELIASQGIFTLDIPSQPNNESYLVASLAPTSSSSLRNKKTSWKTLPTEKVYIMVNDNDFFAGTHAGMMIGESGRHGSLIYDPSGSYDPCRGEKDPYICKTDQKIGSGRVIYNNDTNFKHYVQYQIDDDGANVYVFEFTVPIERLKIINDRIDQRGGGGIGRCAGSISAVINGIPPFGSVWAVRPSELKRILQKIKAPKKGNPF